MPETRSRIDPALIKIQQEQPREQVDGDMADGPHDGDPMAVVSDAFSPLDEDAGPEMLGEYEDFNADPDGDFSDQPDSDSGGLSEDRVSDGDVGAPARAVAEVVIARIGNEYAARILTSPHVSLGRALERLAGDGSLMDLYAERRRQLLAIASAIVERQKAWLKQVMECGEPAERALLSLQPMTQGEVSKLAGLHRDALSRLVNSSGVVLDSPGSPLYPLHFFFAYGRLGRPDVLAAHLGRLLQAGPELSPAQLVARLVAEGVIPDRPLGTRSANEYVRQLIQKRGLRPDAPVDTGDAPP